MLRKSTFILLSSVCGVGLAFSAAAQSASSPQKGKEKSTSWQPPKTSTKPSTGGTVSKARASSEARQEYVVKSGDTPSAIAKRHGLSLKQFLQINKLTAKSVIRPGQRLKVSTASRSSAEPVVAQKSEPAPPTPTRGSGRYGHGTGAAESQYKVKPGESVYSIAKKLGVTEQELMRHNGIKDARRLQVGAVLNVPGALETPQIEGAAALAAGSGNLLPALPKGWRWHTVQKGESLSQIAARYGLSRTLIEQINEPAVAGSLPQKGEHLKIPPVDFASTLAAKKTVTTEKIVPWNERGAEGILGYIVQKDDTYEYLTREFKTSESTIRELNRFTTNEPLIVGRRIVVPNTLFD